MLSCSSPDRDGCFRAVAALVMALHDGGAKSDDIIAALSAASRCEARLREQSGDSSLRKEP